MNKQYNDIIIPEELNIMINKTIKKKNHKKAWLSLSAIAATLLIFTTSLNVSPAFAESVFLQSSLPLIFQSLNCPFALANTKKAQ